MKKNLKTIFVILIATFIFFVGRNVSATTVIYRDAEFNLIPADRLKVSAVAGVTSTIEEGKVIFSVSVPADTTSWKNQVSGEGSTKSYVYSGVLITPPTEEAVKYNALFDAEMEFPYYDTNPAAEIEYGKQHGVSIQNGVARGDYVVGDRTDGNYKPFGERTYITVIFWYDKDNNYITSEYYEVERVLTDPNSESINREAIDSSRINLVEGQENVSLKDNVLTLGENFTDTTVKFKITKPSSDAKYSHYYTYKTEKAELIDDYAIVELAVTSSKISSIIDWYIDIDTSITFEKFDITIQGETTTLKTEDETLIFESNSDKFLPSYKIVLSEETEEEQISTIQESLETSEKIVNLYDINIKNYNDSIVKIEDGSFLIKIKLTDEMKKYDELKVIYVNDKNEIEETFEVEIEGEYLTFNTTHLSLYGIVGVTKTQITNPQTFDTMYIYIILFSVSLLIITGLGIYLKKNNN